MAIDGAALKAKSNPAVRSVWCRRATGGSVINLATTIPVVKEADVWVVMLFEIGAGGLDMNRGTMLQSATATVAAAARSVEP